MRQYAGDTKDAETGKLLLMLDNAKDRNERQGILDKFDMDYVDRDIIAKDNQEFEAVEQQKENILFNRGIQTDAAEEEKAQNLFERQKLLSGEKRDIDAKAFIRKQTLGQQQRDITRDTTTAQHRVSLLENAAKEAELKLQQRAEDLKLKTADVTATTEYRKAKDARDIAQNALVNARGNAQATRQKAEHGIKIEELKKNQENIKKGDVLAEEAIPKIRDANDVNSLITIRKDFRDARLKGIPGAQNIIDEINIKIAQVIDLPSLYKDDIDTPTMTIKGGNQAEKVRSHSNNLQKTVGKLKTILPRSSSKELQAMAENILRKSSPGYGDAMSKLKITPKEFNANYLLNFRSDFRELKEDEDGLTNADIVELRKRFINTDLTPENQEAIGTISGILDTKYKENFTKTRLGTLLGNVDENVLKANMEIASVAGEVDGVVDKKRVIAKHNANVQNLVNLLRLTYADKLTTEEIKTKVTEELLTDPAYADIVKDAEVPYIKEMEKKKNKARMQFNNKLGKAKTAEDFAGIIDFAEINGISDETAGSMYTAKISKIALADRDILNAEITIDPATFTFDGYEKWEREARFTIKKKYDRIPEGTVDKMINSIVDNNKTLRNEIKSYKALQAYKANLQAEMNVLTTAQKISDAKFNTQFKEAPIQTLTSHILSKPTRKLVLESLKSAEQTEDLQDTISNAWEVTNYVYGILKDGYPKDTPEQLGKRSKRVLDTLVPENEIFGKEFTITDWAGDHNLKKEDILRAGKETNRASDF
jgi:hypothetical protein